LISILGLCRKEKKIADHKLVSNECILVFYDRMSLFVVIVTFL